MLEVQKMTTDVIAIGGLAKQPVDAAKTDLNWERLERQDWHLWILNILLILVLGLSLLGFMFPAAFWDEIGSQASVSKRAFFGFCALLGLVLIYLLQRQSAIRKLKRQLIDAHFALAAAERDATRECFRNLPDMTQFRDTLAMEVRRASTSSGSVVGMVIKAPSLSLEGMGVLAKRARSLLRHGESLFRISDKALGIILPKVQSTDARFLAAKLESSEAELIDITTASYPEEVSSLSELEARLRRSQSVAVS
jgi:hypothetical protein